MSKGSKTPAIRPLGDKILVRRDEAQTKTESGIYLPETGKERPKTGVVEAVGTGAINTETGSRIPLTVKKGDRVIFTSYAGTEVKLEGTELLIMGEDDVLAIID
ncbi:MAG: 10 kDa chaperonin [Phycisphaerae bacterium]|nr:MAG: 10 kDa chaperonin [Phycisphaerae bacterium]